MLITIIIIIIVNIMIIIVILMIMIMMMMISTCGGPNGASGDGRPAWARLYCGLGKKFQVK